MLRLLQRRICSQAAEKVRLSSSLSGNGDFPILKGHKAAQDLSKDTLKSHETIKDKEGMMNKPKLWFFFEQFKNRYFCKSKF